MHNRRRVSDLGGGEALDQVTATIHHNLVPEHKSLKHHLLCAITTHTGQQTVNTEQEKQEGKRKTHTPPPDSTPRPPAPLSPFGTAEWCARAAHGSPWASSGTTPASQDAACLLPVPFVCAYVFVVCVRASVNKQAKYRARKNKSCSPPVLEAPPGAQALSGAAQRGTGLLLWPRAPHPTLCPGVPTALGGRTAHFNQPHMKKRKGDTEEQTQRRRACSKSRCA